mmetsp:Transcript_3397/g.7029  ORF Transcript_3397/g.7029 Transcript_3397/m.7029 type:complete len:205 (+) Transcript_3397:241-855(+)
MASKRPPCCSSRGKDRSRGTKETRTEAAATSRQGDVPTSDSRETTVALARLSRTEPGELWVRRRRASLVRSDGRRGEDATSGRAGRPVSVSSPPTAISTGGAGVRTIIERAWLASAMIRDIVDIFFLPKAYPTRMGAWRAQLSTGTPSSGAITWKPRSELADTCPPGGGGGGTGGSTILIPGSPVTRSDETGIPSRVRKENILG